MVLQIDLNEVDAPYDNLKIDSFFNSPSDTTSIDDNNVTSIVLDDANTIWIGTSGNYLNKFNSTKRNFKRFPIPVSAENWLDHLPKQVVLVNNNHFLIGNDLSHLFIWNQTKNTYNEISPVEKNIPIFHIYQDSKDNIWVSTDGNGLYVLNQNGDVIQHFFNDPNNPFSLPNDQPSHVLEDSSGIYWIATYNKGISKLAPSKSVFGHYFYSAGDKNGLSTKIAQSVLEDSKHRLWIGTDGGGLNLFDEKANTFKHYRKQAKNPKSLSSDKILYLLEGNDGNLWVCTWDGGLNKFNPETGNVDRYLYDPAQSTSLGQNTVWCATQDSLNRLWLGTQTAGLNLFDPEREKFYKYKHDRTKANSLISNFVFSLFIDSHKRLFIGTDLGLCFVNLNEIEGYIPEKLSVKEIKYTGIEGNRINYITEDSENTIWVGTDLGLYHLNEQLKLLKSYSSKDGLPNNLVVGVKEDNAGNMWITTKSGLSFLNPQNGVLKNFNVHDGLQGLEFQSKSIDKTDDGRIIVGGINGFNIFKPTAVSMEINRVKPMITGLKFFNKDVAVGDTLNNRVLLDKAISETSSLELKYNEDYISFDFVALNYQNPERVQYRYMMKGLDQDFIEARKNRIASYSNLAPGDYEFQVMAAIDGEWDKAGAQSIGLEIMPPPWKTWWAYLTYAMLIGFLIWISIKYYTKIIREEKEHELDQMKLRFFVNVSHEFRTPLTLILNPIASILASYDNPEEVKKSALLIQRSGQRLLRLVNQLLDFRKMDMGKTPLQLTHVDIVKFSRDIFILFEDLARTKGITFEFNASKPQFYGNFDLDKIEKILTNLLSNSLKFTKNGGNITLSVKNIQSRSLKLRAPSLKKSSEMDILEIKIEDTGVGFKKEQLQEVFGRFFHVDDTKTGTGIGLNFTKGLVELHKGQISVESEYKKGSTFIVHLPANLPISETVDGEKNITEHIVDINSVRSTEYEIAIADEKENKDGLDKIEKSKLPVVLIVEDNKELRLHLKNELRAQFKIKEAKNGEIGLKKITKYYPDLIISDVIMPKIDGFELCRLVKSNLDTSHIPLILLTARSLEEDKIEGFGTGADEYLPKPFNMMVLKARIYNLLDAKKRARERFVKLGGVIPEADPFTNTHDELFIDKAAKIVIEDIDNIDLSLDDIISELGVGRSQFYRKINSITGQNPSSFIRTIRLKYASELLLKNDYSIKEVTHKCGFNSPAYFSKTFKDLFGLTPTKYVKEKKVECLHLL